MFVTGQALLLALVIDAVVCTLLAVYYWRRPAERQAQDLPKGSPARAELNEGTLNRLADEVAARLRGRTTRHSLSPR